MSDFINLPGNSTVNDLVMAVKQLQLHIYALTKLVNDLVDKSNKPKRTKLDKIEQ